MEKRKRGHGAPEIRGKVLQPESEIGPGVTREILELFRNQKQTSLTNQIAPIIEKYKYGRELTDDTAEIIAEEVEIAIMAAWGEGLAMVSIPKFEASRSGSVYVVDMIYKRMEW